MYLHFIMKNIKYTWIYAMGLSFLSLQASCQQPKTNNAADAENNVPIDTAINVGNKEILKLDLKGVSLQGVEPAPVNEEWQALGFKQMPTYVTDPEKASAMALSDCIAYYNYAFYVPNDDIQGAGVFIYQFPDQQKLDNFLEGAQNNDLRRHLLIGDFYIQVWSFYNDPYIAKEHLDILQKYYENLGAKLYTGQ